VAEAPDKALAYAAGSTTGLSAASRNCAKKTAPAPPPPPPPLTMPDVQGLTLGHFSAQLERFSWDRGRRG